MIRCQRQPRAAQQACVLPFTDAPSRVGRATAPDFVLATRHAALGASRRPPAGSA